MSCLTDTYLTFLERILGKTHASDSLSKHIGGFYNLSLPLPNVDISQWFSKWSIWPPRDQLDHARGR